MDVARIVRHGCVVSVDYRAAFFLYPHGRLGSLDVRCTNIRVVIGGGILGEVSKFDGLEV